MDSNYSFEDADFLLKRDWFMSNEDLEDLLWALHQDVFDKVLENWLTYSHRIQDVLCQFIVNEKKAKDLTDDMMDEIWKQREDAMRQKWKDSRNRFVAPPRPKGIFDEEYQRVQSKIQELQTTQPKSIRKANEIRVEIQTLQNECNRLQERIVGLDKLWTDSQWIESVAPASERLTWF